MKKRDQILIVVVSVIVIISIVVTIFQPKFVGTYKEVFETGITVIGLLAFLAQFLYNKSIYVFILINKGLNYICNPGLTWQMTANLEVEYIEQDVLDQFFRQVYTEYSNNAQVNHHTPMKLQFDLNLENISVEVKSMTNIRISTKANINYRESRDQIEQTFNWLLNSLKNINRNRLIEENYSLRIVFKKKNPFYKLYIKTFEKENDVDFNLSYRVDNVSFYVNNTSIEATSKDFDVIKKVSKDYIVLSSN